MSTRYVITFQNSHGSDGNYAFFVDPPHVSGSGTTPEVFTNAWISTLVRDGGRYDIATTVDMFAWAGTIPERPAPGVTVRGGVSRPAALGQTLGGKLVPGSTFEMKIERGVPDLIPITDSAKLAAYQIDTGSDFPSPNDRFLIGLGKIDSYGLVSPVASTLCDNNMENSLTPKMKFYCSKSNFEAGEIVDFQSVSKKAGVIDFSSGAGAGKFVAIITHKSDGLWDVKYYDSYKYEKE